MIAKYSDLAKEQCGDRDETINDTNECRKLAQKEYKTQLPEKKKLSINGDIVANALGTVPKRLERWLEQFEIRGRMETIQPTVL